MTMTRDEMDRRMDEHFGFEARDDVEGVLSTLAVDAEHDVVAGLPALPTAGSMHGPSTKHSLPTWRMDAWKP